MLKRAANSLRALRPRLPRLLPRFTSKSAPHSAVSQTVSHIKAAKIDYPFDPALNPTRGEERALYIDLKVGDSVGDFTVQAIHELDLYKIKIFDLQHKNKNTRYIHLDSADLQNAFAVLFRTPSTNNKGVTHILEHTVLCGSAEFPIRDPFFNMIRRSLNTYMNAWTGSDFTMYPFATQNRNDFYHLLAVYLDAAFAPTLARENFLQEGHRLQFNGNELVRKGVVLNEMKGTMSSADNRVLHELQSTLFPQGTYHFNQGGEPDAIPELSYQEFKEKHSTLYHPHNATFLSYGDLDFSKHIAYIEKHYLNKEREGFQRESTRIDSIARWNKIKNQERPIQAQLTRAASEQGKYVVSLVLNDVPQDQDGYLGFKLHVISKLLTEGPNSSFYKALIESELAPTYGPGVGYDNTTRDATFTISVDGVPTQEKQCVQKLEQVIRHTLRDVAKQGFSERQIEATLHLLNLEIREQKEEFGLKALSAMIPYVLHQGNVEVPFRVHQHSKRLKEELREKGQSLLTDLVQEYFVENQHCVKIAFIPKENIAEETQKKEQEELKKIEKNLTQEQRQEIKATAQRLKQLQQQEQPVERLPSLTIKDIPPTIEKVLVTSEELMEGMNIFYFPQPTNGIIYVRFRADINKVPEQLWPFVPFFTQVASRVGSLNYKHNELNQRIMMCSSGLEVDLDSYVDDYGDEQHALLFEFSFLEENLQEAFIQITELLARPNFKDESNMSELVKELSVQKANNIGQEGLRYALSYGAGLLTNWANRFEALQSDVFVCQMGAQVLKTTDPSPIFSDLGEALYEISRRVLTRENIEFAVHGPASKFDRVASNLEIMLRTIATENLSKVVIIVVFMQGQPELQEPQKLGYSEGPKIFFKTPLTVNHCTESMRVPHYSSQQNAKLRLLGSLLSTNWLHPLIRQKGGAYGAGCRVNESGLLSFFSYFDPRVVETYYHFEEAVLKAVEGKFDEADLEQAKLLTFQRLDRVAPPCNKGLLYFARGYSHEKRELFRKAILETKKDELRDIGREYILKEMEEGRTSRVVVGSMATTASGVMEEEEGWKFYNPTEFLSQKYFEKYNSE